MKGRKPFSKVFEGMGKLLHGDEAVTEEEIIMMVSEGHEQGVLEADEAEMINNIFEFGEKSVAEIMTHRKDVIGVDVTTGMEDAARMMLSENFSRYPVYEEDIENIIGVLNIKDTMRAIMLNDTKDASIRSIMRQPYYVPDSKNIDDLFREMQQKKIQMAIVIDEYGQTAGIVAMEDILEEIVGNIQDEYDEDERLIVENSEGIWTMSGLAPLDEVGEVLGLDFEACDFDTLNGLIISELEHIPAEDEHDSILYENYSFDVMQVKNNMIQEVKVTKLEIPEEDEEK